MNAGCSYLLKFLQDNKDNQSEDWQPPPMDWVTLPTRAVVQGATAHFPTLRDGDLSFAHAEPSKVSVSAKRSRVGVGRLAACLQEELGPPAATCGNGTADATPIEVELPAPADALPTEEWELPAATPGNGTAGAPPTMYGRDGGPLQTPSMNLSLLHGGAGPQRIPTQSPRLHSELRRRRRPKQRQKHRLRPKPKGRQKPRPKRRVQQQSLQQLPHTDVVVRRCLNLPMHNFLPAANVATEVCAVCRRKAGLVLNANRTAWVYQAAA